MIRRNLLAVAVFVSASISSLALAQTADSSKAFMEAHQNMMKNTTMEPSGDTDKDFAMMMIPHHQGAIDMAEIELKYGNDPVLKEMAQKIIDAQKKEIAEFEKWQSEHKM